MLGFFQISSRAARLGDIIVFSFVDLFGVNLMVRIEKKEKEKRVRYVSWAARIGPQGCSDSCC